MATKVTRMFLSFLLILAGWKAPNCSAQEISLPTAEKELGQIYNKVFSLIYENQDSLQYFSALFESSMHDYILKNPQTLDYSFQALKDSNICSIATSADGLFRKYTWNTWLGGTMRDFSEIDQYKSNGKVFAKAVTKYEGDPGSFCSKIYTVNIAGKVYYLSIDNGVYSSKDVSQSIQVYTIDHDDLIDTVSLFKTKKQLLNRIDVQFDFFSVVNRPERPVDIITYDEQQKIIYISVVNDKGVVTDKNIVYQLKDPYFEFIGIEKGKR